jgi:hypothetical protein
MSGCILEGPALTFDLTFGTKRSGFAEPGEVVLLARVIRANIIRRTAWLIGTFAVLKLILFVELFIPCSDFLEKGPTVEILLAH